MTNPAGQNISKRPKAAAALKFGSDLYDISETSLLVWVGTTTLLKLKVETTQ